MARGARKSASPKKARKEAARELALFLYKVYKERRVNSDKITPKRRVIKRVDKGAET